MKNDFVSSARSISDLKAHLVLTTKYRRRILTAEMIVRLRDVITDLCSKWDCKVVEFNGEDNYIELRKVTTTTKLLLYKTNCLLNCHVNKVNYTLITLLHNVHNEKLYIV